MGWSLRHTHVSQLQVDPSSGILTGPHNRRLLWYNSNCQVNTEPPRCD